MITLAWKSCMRWIVLGTLAALCLGMAGTPAWALGPGAPPVIVSAFVWVDTFPLDFGGAAQLVAQVTAEIPGGNVPLNVASVTVAVPAGGTHTLPLDRVDLRDERNYLLNLTQDGVVGFPTGTYNFTVTDTSGGVSNASDSLGSTAGLTPTSLITATGTTPISSQPGEGLSFLLNLATTPTPTISWNAVAGAAVYRLRIRIAVGDELDNFSRQTTGTSMTLPAGVLVPGRRYRVRVEAFDNANAFGCSTACTSSDSNARSLNRIEVVTQGPEIFLTFQKAGGGTTYAAGDTLDVTTRIYNTGPAVTVNAQAWIGTPTLGVIPILNMPGLTITTSTGNPTGPNDFYSGSIGFSYMFTGGEPSGIYVVGLRLTDPATGETVALTSRTFKK
jgi:hypothetical protein